jgi:hypothetical protein
MSKMGLHDPFEHLKQKLWPKEGSGVKLTIWLSTIKSQESTWFPCVQVACDIHLESSWWGLQLCFRPRLNWRFEAIKGLLTPGPSFGHNLCFRCPNGSCKPILDMYVLRSFQLYKKLPNPMGFDPCNRSLKIRESTRAHEMWLIGFTFGSHPYKPLPWSWAQG